MNNPKKLKNLSYLFKYFNKDLTFYSKESEVFNDEIEFFDSNDFLNLKINNTILYSKRNPGRQCERQIEQLIDFEKKNIIIFGFGLGYHLKTLLDKISNKKDFRIIIIELMPKVFYKSLEYIDLEEIMKGYEDVIYFEFIDKNQVKNLNIDFFIEITLLKYVDQLTAYGNNFFVWDNYSKIDEIKEIFSKISETKFNFFKTNIYTNKKHDFNFLQNKLKNYHTLYNSNNILKLKNSYEGPIIIVAAGPSLDKNIDQLKTIKDKIPIFVVGHAYKHLINNGITPTMTGAIDPWPRQKTFLELENKNDKTIIHHILETYPEVMDLDYKHFTMNKSLDEGLVYFTNDINKTQIKYSPENNMVSTSIAHELLQIAYMIGSNRVIFIGQDLCYSKKKYFNNSIKNKEIEDFSDYIKVEGNYEETVYTDFAFYNFIILFENLIKYFKSQRKEFEVINSTSGGAKIKGTKIMSFDESIEKYIINNDLDPNLFINILDKKQKNIFDIDNEKLISKIDQLIELKEWILYKKEKFNKMKNKNKLLNQISKTLNSLLKNKDLINLGITSNSKFTNKVIELNKDLSINQLIEKSVHVLRLIEISLINIITSLKKI